MSNEMEKAIQELSLIHWGEMLTLYPGMQPCRECKNVDICERDELYCNNAITCMLTETVWKPSLALAKGESDE